MPLSSETVPNTPLTGPELLGYTIAKIQEALAAEWIFNPGTSYPRVAFSAEVVFHFGNPSLPDMRVKARIPRNGAVEGEPPLENAPDGGVRAWEISVPPVENPNLERVGADMPIEVVREVRPEPGQLIGKVTRTQVRYDKRDYPKGAAAKVTDVSKRKARDLGVKYDLGDAEDLDAIGSDAPA